MSGIISNPIIFYLVSIILVAFAILTVFFKNIFYSLLSAILVFFLVGIIFYLLGSEYNAVIQIAIYGVAVPIILALAIMFTNTKNYKKQIDETKKYITLFFSGIFVLAVVYLVLTSLVINPVGFNFVENTSFNSKQVLDSIASGFFVNYVLAFEFLSLILTMVVVGLTLFKGGNKCSK